MEEDQANVLSGLALVENLGKPVSDPDVRRMLEALGITERIEIDGDAQTDFSGEEHAVILFFAPAHYAPDLTKGLPKDTPILSDIRFSAYGGRSGSGFVGELPFGLKFWESKESAIERLGDPTWTSLVGNDRWEHGGRYVTLEYSAKHSGIYQITVGLVGQL